MLKPKTLAKGSQRRDGRDTQIPAFLLSRSLVLLGAEEFTELLCLGRHKGRKSPLIPDNTPRDQRNISILFQICEPIGFLGLFRGIRVIPR